MNIKSSLICSLVLVCATPLFAQHSDVEFSYENDAIVMRDGIESFTEGTLVFEGTIPDFGFSAGFTENPGFLAEIVNGDTVFAGDNIEIEILESSSFGTFLTFFSDAAGTLMPTDTTLTICDNAGGNTANLTIGNVALNGDNPQFVQTADSFDEVHSHIDFALSAEIGPETAGAYGILFRLLSDNDSIIDSDPIWLVFNFGMSPVDFDNLAIPAFVGSDLLLGDVNGDGAIDLLDVAPFVDLIINGGFNPLADLNGDGVVDLLDVAPFVALITG